MGQDLFSGSWELETANRVASSRVTARLDIGVPENRLLYPARITLRCDSFQAEYLFLFAKRSTRQIVFSRNKMAGQETPFLLKDWPVLLNGTLEYGKDLRGWPYLEHNRTTWKNTGLNLPEARKLSRTYPETAEQLISFMGEESIRFKRVSETPWVDERAPALLRPRETPTYLSLLDTFFVPTRSGVLEFSPNKDNDIISATLNGERLADQLDSKKRREPEDLLIDTGLNLLLFFADDFGRNGASGASVTARFEGSPLKLDFNRPENLGGSFIAARLYYKYNDNDNTKFDQVISGGLNWSSVAENSVPRDVSGNPIRRTGKVIGSLVARSQQITFAIWDDAVEDGDTISLSINGKWITRGFPVRKKPQFITVTLEPGPNVITFIADNLGSIIPNTSVLEIIDGKKRKSFYIETDLNQNNLVQIFYELKPTEEAPPQE